MKELISKELVFLLVAFLMAIPVAVLFLWLLESNSGTTTSSSDESVLEMQLLVVGGLLGFVGVYFIRLIVWAVKKMSE